MDKRVASVIYFRSMEVTYAGHSCFKIKGKNASAVFDPFDPEKVGFKLPKLEADIVCVSHSHDDHNFVGGVKGTEVGKNPFLVKDPGEYDIKGVHIEGLSTYHDAVSGKERGKNIIYYAELDGFFFLHLGDLGHMLSEAVLEELNTVDVLFIPVGGIYTIDYKMAMDVISEVEPSFVIPMHYQTEKLNLSKKLDGVDKFISEWGSDVVRREQKLKVTTRGELPEETQVVILEQS